MPLTNRATGSFARRLESAWLRRGVLATLLTPLSLVYAGLDAARRLLFRTGVLKSRKLDVPVLVVGNLIVGGAGKTPAVLACIESLRRLGYTPGVVSRGYRTKDAAPRNEPLEVTPASDAQEVGDEPLLVRLRSRAPVVVARDRVAAAVELRRLHPDVDVIVSDDGLQHLRLARDAAVLVFDERGAGNGWLLPAGPLREPMPALVPDKTLVLYNAAAPTTALAGFSTVRTLTGAASLADWWSGARVPDVDTLLALNGRALLAAASVARPERFFSMLESLGLTIDRLPLPDHFDYAAHAPPWPAGTSDVLVTEKDAVKLRPGSAGEHGVRIWVVALDFRPELRFDAALAELFPARPVVTH